ncbi:hypothetical protein SAMN02910453_0484 [Lachnospiraceae bacterium A10]|nr:hypothetical protein SAMN02910453_0484 [Lachnospiraceae bacterium A10]
MIAKNLKGCIRFIFAGFFLWVLVLCLFFQHIEYMCKAVAESSVLKLVFGLLMIIVIYLLMKVIMSRISYKYTYYIILGLVSALLLTAQIYIVYHYFFISGWDSYYLIATAQYVANNGDMSNPDMMPIFGYFSTYPNNLFLTFIYTVLVKITNHLWFTDNNYLVILCFQCLLNTLAGLFMSLSIRKVTGNDALALTGTFIYAVFVGLSPWNCVPYSDQMTLIFPILVIYIYLLKTDKNVLLAIKWMMIFGLVYAGYSIKPQVAIVLIAIMIGQFLKLIAKEFSFKKTWGAIVGGLVGLLLSVFIVNVTVNSLDIPINEEGAYGLAHFAMMGANTDRMGVWAGEDVMFSSTFETKAERDAADWKVFKERISEMGVSGVYMQAVRKTLTNYNDGTFAWWKEGGFLLYPHEDVSAVDTTLKLIYNIETEGGTYNKAWSSVMQCIWLAILILLIPAAFLKNEKYGTEMVVIFLAILGLSLFEMIFECRARYLYLYAPVYVMTAVVGFNKVLQIIHLKGWKRKNETENA